MYQVQARVLYLPKDGWGEHAEDRPTFFVDNQTTHQGAANVAVDILGLSKDDTVLINFAIARVVSWYGIDIRPADRRSTPLDELRIPVLYFEYKRGELRRVGRSDDRTIHEQREEIVRLATEKGLTISPRDIKEIDGEPTIDGVDPEEWITSMTSEQGK